MEFKAVASVARGDSGRERLQARKGKITPEIAEVIQKTTRLTGDNLKYVHITDMVGSLIMLHPRESEGILEIPYDVRKLRGVIIDLERETIVAHGDLLGTAVVAPQLPVYKGKLLIENMTNVEYNPNVEACVYERYIPHVNLRVFRWAGKTYIASHNTIDTVANNSRWGDHGIPFAQLLKECGLEDPESLFPVGCMYSPHVHMFDVCHPSLNICSFLVSAPAGFIISQSSQKAWYTVQEYTVNAGIPIGRIPTAEEIGVPDDYKGYGKVYGKKIESPLDGPGFYDSSFKQGELVAVDKFLQEGYFDVPGPYGTGESVMVTYFDDIGTMQRCQILSPAFSRRKDCMWKNDYNLYRSCILHFSMAPNAFEDGNNFKSLWPPYPNVTQEILDEAKQKGVPAISIVHKRSLPDEADNIALQQGVDPYEYMVQKGKAAPLSNLADALNVIHSNLVYTASPYYVDLVYRSKMRFAVDVRDLIAFIQSMGGRVPADFPADKKPRGPRSTLEKILRNAQVSAQASIDKGQNTYTTKKGKVRYYSTRELVNYYIASTVPKMEGSTLYRLIRAFRLYDNSSSLLITEPNARPRAIVEAERQKFEQEYPTLSTVVKKEEPVVGWTKGESTKSNDDIYGPAAPTCTWNKAATKSTPGWTQPSETVYTSWAEATPVTPPTKVRAEPLPEWLTPKVVTPTPISPPAIAGRGRSSLSTRGSLRGRGRASPRTPTVATTTSVSTPLEEGPIVEASSDFWKTANIEDVL